MVSILLELAQRLPSPPKGFFSLFRRRVFNPVLTSINITPYCNARCETCLVKDVAKYPSFSIEEISAVLSAISVGVPAPANKKLDLWGGEPFLNQNFLFQIIEQAIRHGFKEISISTNGYWGKDIEKARAILRELGEFSLRANIILDLPCDAMHNIQDNLGPSNLANIMFLINHEFRGLKYNLGTFDIKGSTAMLDLVDTYNMQNQRSRANYAHNIFTVTDYQDPSIIIYQNRVLFTTLMLPSQEAISGLRKTNASQWERYLLNWRLTLHFAIGLDREVYLNLMFYPFKLLPMGNINENNVSDILRRIEKNPIAYSLLSCGYKEIIPILRDFVDLNAQFEKMTHPMALLWFHE